MFSFNYALEESNDFQIPQKFVSKLFFKNSDYIKPGRHALKESWQKEGWGIRISKGIHAQDTKIFVLLI